jgi:hypothetical protein
VSLSRGVHDSRRLSRIIFFISFIVGVGKQMAVSLNELGRSFPLRFVDGNVELGKEILEPSSDSIVYPDPRVILGHDV